MHRARSWQVILSAAFFLALTVGPALVADDMIRVGAVLPESGVTYYEVPADYHVTGYRYTYVNDHAVLVDPRTRRIVQIID